MPELPSVGYSEIRCLAHWILLINQDPCFKSSSSAVGSGGTVLGARLTLETRLVFSLA